MLVKDVMTNNVITVDQDTQILEVIKIMKEENLGFIVISEQNKPKGVITDRDILLKILLLKDLTKPIKTIMHKKVITINQDSKISDASDILGNMQIRRLVVTNSDNNICGILSIADLARQVLLEDYALEALTEISYDFSTYDDTLIHVETHML